MATAASSSQGVELQRGNGGGTETFTKVAEITGWTGPTETAAQIDVTSLDSTSREYIAGLRDGGEISFDGNFVASNAEQQGIRSDLKDSVTRNWKILLADHATTPTSIAFAAIVTSWQIKGATDDKVAFSASLKISGDVTYTYAAAS